MDNLFRKVCDYVECPTLDGKVLRFPIVSIFKLWSLIMSETAPGYRDLLLSLPRSTLRAPWNLCIYGDELTPGNVVALDNGRKVFATDFSLRGFGHERLCHSGAWLPL